MFGITDTKDLYVCTLALVTRLEGDFTYSKKLNYAFMKKISSCEYKDIFTSTTLKDYGCNVGSCHVCKAIPFNIYKRFVPTNILIEELDKLNTSVNNNELENKTR